jgi:1,4-alpha-glucan branching enzyme
MLWMGEEFGEHKRKSKNVTQPKKIAWSLLEKDQNRDLFEHYKKLIALRKQNSALQNDNIEFFHENFEAKILAYVRRNEQGNRVVVVANFSEQNYDGYRVSNFPYVGKWHEWIEVYDLEASDDHIILNLEAYQAKVLVQ